MARTTSVWIIAAAVSLAAAQADAATQRRAWDGADVAIPALEAALSSDSLVVELGAGESLGIFGESLTSAGGARAMVALSSEFLTVAVTHGRARLGEGQEAGPGQALLVALDGRRTQRLAFDASRLSASLSPGAAAAIGDDLRALASEQRQGAFWGRYQPIRVNARAPSPAASEAVRQSYLAEPAIVMQRRAGAGEATPAARAKDAARRFVDGFAAGDAGTVSALLDPAPFFAGREPQAALAARRDAAARLLADPGLRAALTPGAAVEVDPSGAFATVASGGRRWRLTLVARDRALFVAALEPLS